MESLTKSPEMNNTEINDLKVSSKIVERPWFSPGGKKLLWLIMWIVNPLWLSLLPPFGDPP
jgi:hypothetical protein